MSAPRKATSRRRTRTALGGRYRARLKAERDADLGGGGRGAGRSARRSSPRPVPLSIRGARRARFLERELGQPEPQSWSSDHEGQPPGDRRHRRRFARGREAGHARRAAGDSGRHGALGLHVRHIRRLGKSGTELEPGRGGAAARVEPRPSRSARRRWRRWTRARAARDSVAEQRRLAWKSATRRGRIVAARIDQLDGAMAKAQALHDLDGGRCSRRRRIAARCAPGASGLPGAACSSASALDADAYEAAVKAREAAALFPRPVTSTEGSHEMTEDHCRPPAGARNRTPAALQAQVRLGGASRSSARSWLPGGCGARLSPTRRRHPALPVPGGTLEIRKGAPTWSYMGLAKAAIGDAISPEPVPGRVAFDESRSAPDRRSVGRSGRQRHRPPGGTSRAGRPSVSPCARRAWSTSPRRSIC